MKKTLSSPSPDRETSAKRNAFRRPESFIDPYERL